MKAFYIEVGSISHLKISYDLVVMFSPLRRWKSAAVNITISEIQRLPEQLSLEFSQITGNFGA